MKSLIALLVIAVTALPWLDRIENSKVTFISKEVEPLQKDHQQPPCITNLSMATGCNVSAPAAQKFVLVRGQLLPI